MCYNQCGAIIQNKNEWKMFKKPSEVPQQSMYSLRKNKDTNEMIKCPACDNDMTKIYIPEFLFHIDVCAHGCGGIFFDNREMEFLQTPVQNIDKILNLIHGNNFIKTDETAKRRCPNCHTIMLKTRVQNANIVIDVCPVCGGRFLDNGELDAIRDSYLGVYEKSVIEFALKNPKSFSVICSEIIRKSV